MKKNKNKIDTSILITISVISVALAIAFIIQLCRIYFGNGFNNRPFTREIVINYLLQILAIVIIWVLVVAVGGVYLVYKGHKTKDRTKPNNMTKLENLKRLMIIDEEVKETEEYKKYNLEQIKMRIGLGINCAILILCIVMAASYTFNPNNFIYDSSDSHVITNQIKDLVVHVLPWIVIAFISSTILTIFNEFSAKKLLSYCKTIISKKGKKVNSVYKNIKKEQYIIYSVQACVVVIAVVFVVLGILNGGATSALNKAINICTECIGLG